MIDVVGLTKEEAEKILKDEKYNVEVTFLKNISNIDNNFRTMVTRQKIKCENTIEILIDLIKVK